MLFLISLDASRRYRASWILNQWHRLCVTTPVFERARLQPCRDRRKIGAALAAEVCILRSSHVRPPARFLSAARPR
jgi:hypothetical protein